MILEALCLIFICGGIAIWLKVSFIIAAMVMGSVIANFAKHHDYAFHEIENIEWPFMVIFFIVAGASLEVGALQSIGIVGAVYILFRIAGKFIGAWIGCFMSNADTLTKKWMGLALLPQAGVATGMALVAANQFPEYKQLLLSVAISTTVFFELVGPIFTRLAVKNARDSQQ